MKTILAFTAAAAAVALISTPANAADFIGSTVNVQYYFPTDASPYPDSGNGNYVVGAGVEVPSLIGEFSIDVSANNILMNFFRTATFSTGAFNGWVLSDQTNNLSAITGVTINPLSNMGGFSASNLIWSADSISINWQGLSFNESTVLSLDVAFDSAVPEPGTWAMMLLGFGGVGFAMRRRPKLAVIQAA